MATTQLERISGLVEKLEPVADKRRGMRIEAEEWNTLVEVLQGVLQLDRLQEQRTDTLLDERYAAKDHEHLGKIGLAWLDADLQARLGGATNSVATRQSLAEMDQKVTALSGQVAKLSAALEAMQRVLDSSLVNNADKNKKILTFEDRFKGLEDLRTTVTTLSNDVGSVRVNVDKVLDLRNSLQDEAGNPISVLQIKRDLTDLQSVRENLKGADGKPLRLRDLELKIGEVADVVGVGATGGLEGRFANLSATLQDAFATRTDASIKTVKTEILAQNASLETRLRNEIQVSSQQTRDAASQQLDTKLGTATTTFNSTLDTRFDSLRDTLTKNAVDKTTLLLNQKLADLTDKTQLETALGNLRSTLTSSLQASFTATLTAQIKDVDTRVGQQIGIVQAATKTLSDSIPGIVSSRIDDALPGIKTTLGQQTATQLETTKTAIENGLNTRVSTIVSNSLQNLDTRIATAVNQQTAGIDGKISTAVTSATKNIPANVADEVKAQIADANLDGKILDGGKAIAVQLKSDLKSALADQDARTSGAIQSSVALLQGQISAATTSTLNAAKDFSTAQGNGLRTELTTLVDNKVNTTRDLILGRFDTQIKATRDEMTVDFNRKLDTQIKTVNDRFSNRVGGLETRIGRLG